MKLEGIRSHYNEISCARLYIWTYYIGGFTSPRVRINQPNVSVIQQTWVLNTGKVQEHPPGQALRRAHEKVQVKSHYRVADVYTDTLSSNKQTAGLCLPLS